MSHRLAVIVCVAIICILGRTFAASADTYVDVELVIAVDVSGSVSAREHEVQRQGYLAAFEDEALIRAIQSGPNKRVAVTYLEWANQFNQHILVPWRIVSDRQSAHAFRDELARKRRTLFRGTSLAGALEFSALQFGRNRFQGIRRVIDLSGDGPNRTGPLVNDVRDTLVAQGIIINGLPIMLSPAISNLTHGLDLADYFEDCVIGGPGAFVYPVRAEAEMAEAIRRKLILEVSGQPARVWRASQEPRPKSNCQIGRGLYD